MSSDDSQCIASPTEELSARDAEPIEPIALSAATVSEPKAVAVRDINVSTNTGLRKTGFSDNLYANSTSPKKANSKIPLSPMTRRRSVDSAAPVEPVASLARQSPTNRSVRKSQSKEAIQSDGTAKKVNGTWSGRLGIRKRPSVDADTFRTNNNNNNNVSKYDMNGRQTRSKHASPVKSANASPLAQKIVEMAENAACDEQMLEKMKELLSKYSSKSKGITSPSRSARSSSTSSPAKNRVEFEDFTTAWVNSNGSLDRVSACCSPNKSPSKRSSAASSMDSNSLGKDPIITARRDRGTTRIPAPVRQNTDLY